MTHQPHAAHTAGNGVCDVARHDAGNVQNEILIISGRKGSGAACGVQAGHTAKSRVKDAHIAVKRDFPLIDIGSVCRLL